MAVLVLAGLGLAGPPIAHAEQSGAVADQTLEDRPDTQPVHEDRARGFAPAEPGEPGPTLPFPGLTRKEANEARAELAKQDARDFAAAARADSQYRESGGERGPVDPQLDHGEPTDYEPSDDSPRQVPELAPSADKGTGGAEAASGCSGNCYQSDRIQLTDPSTPLYASEYWVWLAVPQTYETNKCDGNGYSSACFWFAAMNHYTNSSTSTAAFHIGPQRGTSIAGATGTQWRMNIDGYINGSHIGGQSSVSLPVATWIRVRTWRLSYGSGGGGPWSTWGVWAYYNGSDHYLGSLTIDGQLLTDSIVFQEIYEENGQCTTDFERTYFNDYRWWNTSASQQPYSKGTADYESNCVTTSWERPTQYSGEFLRDERETVRSIGQGWTLWQYI